MSNDSMYTRFDVPVYLITRAAHLKQKQWCKTAQVCGLLQGNRRLSITFKSIIISPHVVGKGTLIQAEGL